MKKNSNKIRNPRIGRLPDIEIIKDTHRYLNQLTNKIQDYRNLLDILENQKLLNDNERHQLFNLNKKLSYFMEKFNIDYQQFKEMF